ncbi:MAG: cupin domain-containing protein [Patescibacteria group bacterium]|jgi:quercetin dioxygenase-like cupin family protein|nr:cupin domain-containing protein [Patescibacteria group bacterium]
MKIIKRSAQDILKEEAHGGGGSRKVFASNEHLKSVHFDAMTYGYIPPGKSYDWHDHKDTEEIMVVLKGEGEVSDEDGVYKYAPGDVFVYPANIEHKIHNPTNYEHEFIFVRVKV